MRSKFLFAAFASLIFAAAAFAQKAPNFGGTWTLDVSKSKLGDRNNIESQTLTVTQSDKDIKIETATKRTPPPNGGGGGGGGGFGGGGGNSGGRYSLTFSLNFNNILNHTNLANPVGNLGSLLFGASTSTAGGFGGFGGGNPAYNRRIDAQVRFTF